MHYHLITSAPEPITVSVCLSQLISLFSFSSSTRDLSLSFSQTAPLPYLPTVCLNHFLLWHVLYLPCSPVNLPLTFLPPPPPHSVTLVCPPSSCLLSFSQVPTFTDCTLFPSSFFVPTVKDLDTEKYVHLVSISYM